MKRNNGGKESSRKFRMTISNDIEIQIEEHQSKEKKRKNKKSVEE